MFGRDSVFINFDGRRERECFRHLWTRKLASKEQLVQETLLILRKTVEPKVVSLPGKFVVSSASELGNEFAIVIINFFFFLVPVSRY